MTPRTKLTVTIALVLFLVVLGVADYKLSGSQSTADVTTGTNSTTSTGVAVNNGPDVQSTITSLGFTSEQGKELSFLAQIVGTSSQIDSLAILKDGDRAGSVTWIESASVKNDFTALKNALLTAFSPRLQNLQDQTFEDPNQPVRNVLSFFDPALSSEKLTFVRVRERLYEFHIANGKDDVMQGLIDALTTK